MRQEDRVALAVSGVGEATQRVRDIIRRTGVPPASIELELTERMVMEDVESAARTLAPCKTRAATRGS